MHTCSGTRKTGTQSHEGRTSRVALRVCVVISRIPTMHNGLLLIHPAAVQCGLHHTVRVRLRPSAHPHHLRYHPRLRPRPRRPQTTCRQNQTEKSNASRARLLYKLQTVIAKTTRARVTAVLPATPPPPTLSPRPPLITATVYVGHLFQACRAQTAGERSRAKDHVLGTAMTRRGGRMIGAERMTGGMTLQEEMTSGGEMIEGRRTTAGSATTLGAVGRVAEVDLGTVGAGRPLKRDAKQRS